MLGGQKSWDGDEEGGTRANGGKLLYGVSLAIDESTGDFELGVSQMKWYHLRFIFASMMCMVW